MRFLLALCAFSLLPADLAAQEPTTPALRLLIVVRDADTQAPLAGANVAVGNELRTTNVDGRALFSDLAPGEQEIAAAFLGYTATDTTLVLSRSSRVTFLLPPEAVALDAINVEADKFNAARLQRSGFYERRDTRSGTFKTIEELEEAGAIRFSDIFRGVTGLRIESQFGQTRITSTRRRDCSPAVFFDGVAARGLAMQLDTVPLDGVLAVEIYKGPAEVPAEFSADINQTQCGAILVWTRAR
ncbi:TonB-dependent receptor plug domain-containing protein [Rubricoccus marinus]|uniref:TonB-dependent receptor plug domain-containing protein n=1 Tax=Rubricoccus marinus TaxID=716817 RepID=A0A259TWU6_9BACT|nr:carboxypeptidase regulatory-like domain-containing protein [Rubricoccus marinus]OZC02097.1 hypothetical protein BSZ36_03320 [Rubricoccus marinus]